MTDQTCVLEVCDDSRECGYCYTCWTHCACTCRYEGCNAVISCHRCNRCEIHHACSPISDEVCLGNLDKPVVGLEWLQSGNSRHRPLHSPRCCSPSKLDPRRGWDVLSIALPDPSGVRVVYASSLAARCSTTRFSTADTAVGLLYFDLLASVIMANERAGHERLGAACEASDLEVAVKDPPARDEGPSRYSLVMDVVIPVPRGLEPGLRDLLSAVSTDSPACRYVPVSQAGVIEGKAVEGCDHVIAGYLVPDSVHESDALPPGLTSRPSFGSVISIRGGKRNASQMGGILGVPVACKLGPGLDTIYMSPRDYDDPKWDCIVFDSAWKFMADRMGYQVGITPGLAMAASDRSKSAVAGRGRWTVVERSQMSLLHPEIGERAGRETHHPMSYWEAGRRVGAAQLLLKHATRIDIQKFSRATGIGTRMLTATYPSLRLLPDASAGTGCYLVKRRDGARTAQEFEPLILHRALGGSLLVKPDGSGPAALMMRDGILVSISVNQELGHVETESGWPAVNVIDVLETKLSGHR